MSKYPTYLIHFNKNHSKNNGRFDFGDGDGDGKIDEWGRRKYKNTTILNRMKGLPSKGGVTNRHSSYEDRNVDDAKLTNRQYNNASNMFKMKRSMIKNAPSKGKSFVDNSGVTDWSIDDQKLSKSDSAKEVMRRQFNYAMIDLTEDDEEQRRKKKGKYTQSTWGDNFVTTE